MIFLLLLFGSVYTQFAETREYSLLAKERQNVNFVEYTKNERLQVAESMVNLLTIYVNRHAKIEYYGREYQNIDPIPRAKAIQKVAENMTTSEFHYSFSELFLSLRDGHTSYEFPGPHSCYEFVQAVSFDVVKSKEWAFRRRKLVVAGFNKNNQVLDLSGPEISKISLGDEVLAIDSMTLIDYIEYHKYSAGGANDEGALRAALTHMSVRNGKIRRPPEKDYVEYLMKSRKNGQYYFVTLPWVSSLSKSCFDDWQISSPLSARRIRETINSSNTKVNEKINHNQKFNPVDLLKGENEDTVLFAENFVTAPKRLNSFKLFDTTDPILKYGIWNPEKYNMGIIVLSSFLPGGRNAVQITKVIRGLLIKELKDTDSLLIDVRDNPGGLINMADYLPQLFGGPITSISGRALVNDINSILFRNSFTKTDIWSELYFKSAANGSYSNVVPFTPQRHANFIGQAYIKPVGVFTNARCYSSCDMFTANMKDNGLAIIFGEDKTTGGGGANVVKYNDFLVQKGNGVFQKFPYSTRSNSQDAKVAWRQCVRVKSNSGKLIEDFGILAEYYVPPVIEDLLPDSGLNSQYDFIANKLKESGVKSGKANLKFEISGEMVQDVPANSTVELDLKLKGISKVRIINERHQKLVHQLIISSLELGSVKMFKLKFQEDDFYTGLQRYIVEGIDSSNNIVFSTIHTVRFIPAVKLDLKPLEIKTLEFIADYSAVFVLDIRPQNNYDLTVWNRTSDSLTIGNSGSYTNLAETSISWFLNVGEMDTVELFVDVLYKTEADNDVLTLTYTSSFGIQHLLSSFDSNSVFMDGVSGEGRITQSFTLMDLVGETEISFGFSSDESDSSGGIEVIEIKVSGLEPNLNETW